MFVKTTNGEIAQYPYSVGLLRRDNPNTSFPKSFSSEMLASYGVYEVKRPPAPGHDPETHFVEYSPVPSFADGSWVYSPSVRPLSSEQIAERTARRSAEVRAKRSGLLSETDWAALSDVTMSPEMTAYRQALRDITAQAGFPDNVTWPTKPA
jgi:hypothetical protein